MAGVIPDAEIEASCAVYPSEDPKRVAKAVSNVLGTRAETRGDSAAARSGSLSSLEALRDAMRSRRQQAAYRRRLEHNLDGDSTWFYLNKQAAFAGRMALCGEADESPLGPITVRIRSPDIGAAIGWLVSE